MGALAWLIAPALLVTSIPPASGPRVATIVEGAPFVGTGNSGALIAYAALGYDLDRVIRSARQAGLSAYRIFVYEPVGQAFGVPGWEYSPELRAKATDLEWRLRVFDRLLDVGSKVGMRFVISIYDFTCCGGHTTHFKDEASYLAAHPYAKITQAGARDGYKRWAETLITRKNTVNGTVWREDPAILAWDLANEPIPRFSQSLLKDITCNDLRAWISEMSAFIRERDQRHALTIGLGDDMCVRALDGRDLDYFSFHWYPSAKQDIHGLTLSRRIADFAKLGKPVVISEFSPVTKRPAILDDGYVRQFTSTMDEAFCAGAAGFMFFGWGPPEVQDPPVPRQLFGGSAPQQWPPYWAGEGYSEADAGLVTALRNYRFRHSVTATTKHGTVAGAGCHEDGSAVSVSIERTSVPVNDGTRAVFTGWSGDSTSLDAQIRLTVDAPKTVIASWRIQHLLTVRTEVGRSVGEGWHDEGSIATFRVEPLRVPVGPFMSRRFVRWTGDTETAAPEASMRMDRPKTVIAEWSDEVEPLSVAGAGGAAIAAAWVVGGLLARRRSRRR